MKAGTRTRQCKAITGSWILPGDFNPIVVLPVFQVIQYPIFKIAGISLVQARLQGIIWFLVLQGCLFLTLKRLVGLRASLVAALVIATNPFLFAYSRLAFLEIPMLALIMGVLWLVVSVGEERSYAIYILAGIIFAVALLVKTTAIFSIPLVIFSIWYSRRSDWLKAGLLFAASCFLVWGLYNSWARITFPADYSFFQQLNIAARFSFSPVTWLKNLARIITSATLIEEPIILLSFLSALLLGFIGKARKSPIYQLLAIWICLAFGLLCSSYYQPPRYFMPLILGSCLMVSFGLEHLEIHFAGKNYFRFIPQILAVILVGYQCFWVIRWQMEPSFSMVETLQEISARIKEDNLRTPVILGQMANTVGLETKLVTINDLYGTDSLKKKLHKFQPDYYISIGEWTENPDIASSIAQDYKVTLIKGFDVYRNYYFGKRVYFYRLEKLTSPGIQ
jgi:hypothetical protein